MPISSRRTLLLSALLFAASINVWANPAGQGATAEDRKQALDRFIAKKFVKEPFYLIDLDEADRLKYEVWVNQLARSLRKLAPSRQINDAHTVWAKAAILPQCSLLRCRARRKRWSRRHGARAQREPAGSGMRALSATPAPSAGRVSAGTCAAGRRR
jgi:hypothetical protein